MKYDQKYFESGRKSSQGNLSHIKNSIPKKIVAASSKKHLEIYLNERWKPFKKCKRVLDIGCGEGEFLRLNPFNIQIEGLDISKEMVNKLKKENFKVNVGDINKKLNYADSSFDGIACFHVLEHLSNPPNTIKELKRILKNGGVLMISVPSLKYFYDDYTHVKYFSKKALYRVLKDNNFERIKITKGISQSRLIGAIFFFVPNIRFMFERLFGKISPFEIIAISKNKK